MGVVAASATTTAASIACRRLLVSVAAWSRPIPPRSPLLVRRLGSLKAGGRHRAVPLPCPILRQLGTSVIGGPPSPPALVARGDRSGWERVHLSDLQFTACHGVLPAERQLGQRFVVDIVIDARLAAVTVPEGGSAALDTSAAVRAAGHFQSTGTSGSRAPTVISATSTLRSGPTSASSCPSPQPFRGWYADDVARTLDYSAVYRRVASIMTTGPPAALVESLAAAVAEDVLTTQPLSQAVWVRVTKPHVALGGVVEGVGVEVYRVRDEVDEGSHREESER